MKILKKNKRPSRLDDVRWVTTTPVARRIVIELAGGLVQEVYVDGVPATYFVVDLDVEGADTERVTTTRHNGQKFSAYLHACEALPLSSARVDVRRLLSAEYPEDFPPPPKPPRRQHR